MLNPFSTSSKTIILLDRHSIYWILHGWKHWFLKMFSIRDWSLISLSSQASRRRRGSRNLPLVIALRGRQIAQKLHSPRNFLCLQFFSSPATVLTNADSIYCTDQLMRSSSHVAAWNLASNGHNPNVKVYESCELIWTLGISKQVLNERLCLYLKVTYE